MKRSLVILSSQETAGALQAFAERDARLIIERLALLGVPATRQNWEDHGRTWQARDHQGVLVRSVWNYHERRVEPFLRTLDAIGAATELHNAHAILRWNVDKAYLRELGERGIAVNPSLYVAEVPGDLAGLCRARGWDDVVVKPSISANSFLTVRARLDVPAEVAQAVDTIGNIVALGDRTALVQPFIPAFQEVAEHQLVYIDGIFCHGIRKPPYRGDPKSGAALVSSAQRFVPSLAQLEFGARVLRATRFQKAPLIARLDFIELAAGPMLLEAELVEPWLYPELCPEVYAWLCEALLGRLSR